MTTLDMSSMPDRWFLDKLTNNRTPIRRAGDKHNERTVEEMRWRCELQTINGGLLTVGMGSTPQKAFDCAVEEVLLVMDDEHYRHEVMK